MAGAGQIIKQVEAALEKDDEPAAIALLERLGGTAASADESRRLALLARSIERNDLALAALDLAPDTRRSLLLRFQLRSEAGEPVANALASFVGSNATAGPELLQLVGALDVEGRCGEAAELLEQALGTRSDWLAGHQALAQLRFQAGDPDPARSLGQALAREPGHELLWAAWLGIVSRTCDWPRFERIALEAARRFGGSRLIAMICADGFSEMGREAQADRLFAQLADVADPDFDSARIRHAMRFGRFDQAAAIGEQAARSHGSGECWGWLGAAWRLAGDSRGDWFYRGGDLVAISELRCGSAEMAALAGILHRLHRASGPPLGQSPRGGSQTPGPLLKRLEPEIRLLRRNLKQAVGNYIDQLPPAEHGHPFLGASRNAFRFEGAWSIKLRPSGRHVSHIHSHGWISSALYVEIPHGMSESSQREGWLQVGVPPLPERESAVPPLKVIAPKVARLALFPSLFWHGTRPFRKGERLTVAFDVVPR